MRQPYATDITKGQFKHMEPILSIVRKKTKPTKIDIYDVFCAVKYVLNTGCQWRNIPHDIPKWQTLYSYYRKWSEIDERGESAIATALKKCHSRN